MSSQKLIDEKIEKLSNQQPENLAAVNDSSIQYVPDDIGNINVDEIVDKLGHVEGMCNLPNRNIVKGTQEFGSTRNFCFLCRFSGRN
jgi:hypothetical protein